MRYLFLSLLIVSSQLTYAQSSEDDIIEKSFKNDASVSILPIIGATGFSGQFKGRMYLEYRRKIAPTFFLKGSISTRDEAPLNINYDIHVNDTARLRPSVSYYKNFDNIRIGFDKELNNGLVSVGSSLIIGRSRNTMINDTRREVFDSTYNVWVLESSNCNFDPTTSFALCDYVISSYEYFDIGISFNVNLNLAISDRWGLHVRYEPQLIYRNRTKTSERIEGDPYTGIIDPISFETSSHDEFRHNVDFNLRFKF